MMRDHPLGVGWNQAVSVYAKNYSPPEGGAAALTMNSYLMLGTELGLPGLICFIGYVALALKGDRRWRIGDGSWQLAVGEKAKSGKRSCDALAAEKCRRRLVAQPGGKPNGAYGYPA